CSLVCVFDGTVTTALYTLSLHDALPIYAEIVGVVEHVLHYGLDGQGPVAQAFYVPWAGVARQAPQFATRMTLAIRSRVDPLSLRSEEHTSELQSQSNLVCRLLLEKKKNT